MMLCIKKWHQLIDVIGVVGVDPGNYWPAGTGSTLDNTLSESNVDGPSEVGHLQNQ